MAVTMTRQISRRGRGDPGGLATALNQAFNPLHDKWFHMGGKDGSTVYRLQQHSSEPIGDLGAGLVQLAYREANMAWPLLHEMGERFLWSEIFRSKETGRNQLLNERFARLIMADERSHDRSAGNDTGAWTHFVVHDYPLAPLPALLREINQKARHKRNTINSYVCHTSWPRWEFLSDKLSGLDANERRERVSKLKVFDKLALGMLGADLLFFHTKIWAQNFADYIQGRFGDKENPEYKVCSARDNIKIAVLDGNSNTSRTIDLIVHPIGVDIDFWTQAASGVLSDLYVHMGHSFELPQNKKVLFSYGRLDYTKGVPKRWQAIVPFLTLHPELQSEALFLEVGGPTRGGLPGFGEEWEECVELCKGVQDVFPDSLLWIDRLLPQSAIAPLSRLSRVGLFSSIMDGCNLACKEWLECQDDADPGVLCLSRTAGAWEELGGVALELNPHDPQQMAHTFHRAVTMPLEERRRRTARGKTILQLNPVQYWAEHIRRAAEDKISRLQFAA